MAHSSHPKIVGYTRVNKPEHKKITEEQLVKELDVYATELTIALENVENCLKLDTPDSWVHPEQYEDFLQGILSIEQAEQTRWVYIRSFLVDGLINLLAEQPEPLLTRFSFTNQHGTESELLILDRDTTSPLSASTVTILRVLPLLPEKVLKKWGLSGVGLVN